MAVVPSTSVSKQCALFMAAQVLPGTNNPGIPSGALATPSPPDETMSTHSQASARNRSPQAPLSTHARRWTARIISVVRTTAPGLEADVPPSRRPTRDLMHFGRNGKGELRRGGATHGARRSLSFGDNHAISNALAIERGGVGNVSRATRAASRGASPPFSDYRSPACTQRRQARLRAHRIHPPPRTLGRRASNSSSSTALAADDDYSLQLLLPHLAAAPRMLRRVSIVVRSSLPSANHPKGGCLRVAPASEAQQRAADRTVMRIASLVTTRGTTHPGIPLSRPNHAEQHVRRRRRRDVAAAVPVSSRGGCLCARRLHETVEYIQYQSSYRLGAHVEEAEVAMPAMSAAIVLGLSVPAAPTSTWCGWGSRCGGTFAARTKSDASHEKIACDDG